MPKKPSIATPTEPTGPVALHYIGDGEFIVGVPTEDHEVDAAEAERLIATGLYAPADASTTTSDPAADAATTAKE